MKLAKLRVFAVRDSKISAFGPPMTYQHVGQATRQWQEIANDASSNICKYPADFSLWEIGEYDDETGILVAITPIVLISQASEMKDSVSDLRKVK